MNSKNYYRSLLPVKFHRNKFKQTSDQKQTNILVSSLEIFSSKEKEMFIGDSTFVLAMKFIFFNLNLAQSPFYFCSKLQLNFCVSIDFWKRRESSPRMKAKRMDYVHDFRRISISRIISDFRSKFVSGCVQKISLINEISPIKWGPEFFTYIRWPCSCTLVYEKYFSRS